MAEGSLTFAQLDQAARETAIRLADHNRRHNYAFHRDGEPCLVAITSRNCPENHRYGRTFEESH